MAAFSKYLTARNSSLAGAALLLLCLLHKRRRNLGLQGKKNGKPPLQNNEKEGKKERAMVDKVFFSRLTKILKIMVPRTFCKETGYLILIAVMLVSRTYCDVWMIQNGTLIESGIIGRSRKDFKRYLFNFIAAMPLISLVNNFLKFGLNELKLCFRVRLTKYLYEEYLQAFTYYKMGNLDNRIANPDQLLTQDVEKFCNSVVDLYSNLSKPFLDIVLYIFKLTSAIGAQVPSGANVLICGPNGCGKSSLFRVLGELWPLFGGRLTKPERGKLFYVPQRPYMTLGTLRDQVIYPDGREDQKKKGISDLVLKDYLDNVQLGHILEREGGWDSVQDWMDVLSGGEKQRMAMARLFYHKPQFAILDECTSAVSVDVEDYIYSHCRKVGITLFTVSHRKSLWKHHEYYLHMDGRGNYEFKQITEDTVEFGS
ncbi:ATP-binding cassette sub-family D member 3 isoform 4-T4 [Trichechus inunguis]